jgi:hypothetical protein
VTRSSSSNIDICTHVDELAEGLSPISKAMSKFALKESASGRHGNAPNKAKLG